MKNRAWKWGPFLSLKCTALYLNIYIYICWKKSIMMMGLDVTHCQQNPTEHYFRNTTLINQPYNTIHSPKIHTYFIPDICCTSHNWFLPKSSNWSYLPTYPESCNWPCISSCLLGYQPLSKPRISKEGRFTVFWTIYMYKSFS